MKNPEFEAALNKALHLCGLYLSQEQKTQLNIYDRLLVEWNEKINLTALTSDEDVALKHFCDSLTVLRYAEIPSNAKVIDVGTGAGFPGLVLKIARPDLRLSLLDSLKKRLTFLEEVCIQAEVENVELIHSRAEDGAREEAYRDRFDVAVSRAVAPLNVLCEYCLPYIKAGGLFIAMKGKDYEEELALSENAVKKLGAKVEKISSFELEGAGQRAIICIRKESLTPIEYPRTSKKIKNHPL